jgi:hypothetical protein
MNAVTGDLFLCAYLRSISCHGLPTEVTFRKYSTVLPLKLFNFRVLDFILQACRLVYKTFSVLFIGQFLNVTKLFSGYNLIRIQT